MSEQREMSWEQMARAMHALGDFRVTPLEKGWRVSLKGVEIKEGGLLASKFGEASGIGESFRDLWHKLTRDLKPDHYLVCAAGGNARRALRWNGFMWKDVDEGVSTS